MNKQKKNRNKGFSLVELIVVIAIMAILVGVAVPVYTSYIEKSQKAKDIQLVDEVKHAVEIAAAAENWGKYATGDGNLYVGAVILKNSGTSVTLNEDLNGKISLDTVMKDTFGADYETKLSLSYDWYSTLNTANATKLIASSYCKDGVPSKLLGDVQVLTDAVKDLIESTGGDMNLFNAVGLDEDWMTQNGLNPSNWQERANAVTLYVAQNASKLTEQEVIDAFKTNKGVLANADPLTSLASEYAYYEAWVSHLGTDCARDVFAEKSALITGASANDIITSVGNLETAVEDHIRACAACQSAPTYNNAAKNRDAVAFQTVLKQIALAKDKIVSDKGNESLYTSEGITSYVTTYISTADVLKNANVTNEDVAILLTLSKTGALVVYIPISDLA